MEVAVFIGEASFMQELPSGFLVASQGAIEQGWSSEFSGKLFKGVNRDSMSILVAIAVVVPGDS